MTAKATPTLRDWLHEAATWDAEAGPLAHTAAATGVLNAGARYRYAHAAKKGLAARRSAYLLAVEQVGEAWARGGRDGGDVGALEALRDNIRAEVEGAANGVLTLVGDVLEPGAASLEDKVAYATLRGDVMRYLSEVHDGDAAEADVVAGNEAYRVAHGLALDLEPASPAALGCALNYAVFLWEILGRCKEAYNTAVNALNTATEWRAQHENVIDAPLNPQTPIIINHLRKLLGVWEVELGLAPAPAASAPAPAAFGYGSELREARTVGGAGGRYDERLAELHQADGDGNVITWRTLADQAAVCDAKAEEAARMATQATGEALSKTQRAYLAFAFKNSISVRRSMWQLLTHHIDALAARQGASASENSYAARLAESKSKVNDELDTISRILLSLIADHLLPTSTAPDTRVFYLTLQGDMYRYLAECTDPESQANIRAVRAASEAYETGHNIAAASLSPVDPIRLSTSLNYCVFYYDVLASPADAVTLARTTLTDALDADGLTDPVAVHEAHIIIDHLANMLETMVDKHAPVDADDLLDLVDAIRALDLAAPVAAQPEPVRGASGRRRRRRSKSTKKTADTAAAPKPSRTSAASTPRVPPPREPTPPPRSPSASPAPPSPAHSDAALSMIEDQARRIEELEAKLRRLERASASPPHAQAAPERLGPQRANAPAYAPVYRPSVSPDPRPVPRHAPPMVERARYSPPPALHSYEPAGRATRASSSVYGAPPPPSPYEASLSSSFQAQQSQLAALRADQARLHAEQSRTAAALSQYAAGRHDGEPMLGTSAPAPRGPQAPLSPTFPLVFTAALVVTWSPPAVNGPYTSYRVYRSTPGATFELVYEGPGLMFYDAGLKDDTIYTYAVAACNASNAWSAMSQPATQKTRVRV